MNKTLLINRINYQDFTPIKKNIFFLIGDINTPEVDNKLMNILKNTNLFDKEDIIFKYNGVELKISVQKIPEIIKLFVQENISVYSVYQIYNPEA